MSKLFQKIKGKPMPIYMISKYQYITPKRRRKKEQEYREWLDAHKKRMEESNLQDKLIEVNTKYATSLDEAIKRVCRLSRISIDETIEFECQMNLDPKRGNEYIRGNVTLPNGIGKSKKICVFLPNHLHENALENGADIIGNDKLLNDIKEGIAPNFDVIIATPDQLKRLVPFGRQLGPRGLMPNVKLGTLTNDPMSAIKLQKKGQVYIVY